MAAQLGAASTGVMTIDLGGIRRVGADRRADRRARGRPSGRHPGHLRAGAQHLFLSLALAWAEVLGAHDIFIGMNAVDYSGYPDCRPEYIAAFERLANLATRAGVEGAEPLRIHAPLIDAEQG